MILQRDQICNPNFCKIKDVAIYLIDQKAPDTSSLTLHLNIRGTNVRLEGAGSI